MQRIDEKSLMSKVVPGDASHGQAFVHLDDLCDAFVRAVDRRKDLPADSTLLIGEPGAPASYAELQRELARLMHGESDWPTTAIPKPLAKTGAWLQDKAEDIVPDAIDQGEEPFIKPFMIDLADDHFELDIARAKHRLDWQPSHSLRESLPRMVEVMKADPADWYARNKLTSPSGIEPKRQASFSAPEKRRIAEHVAMMDQLHKDILWAHFVVIFLGFWLVSSPFALG